jgi:large subunit ribosomal protein L19
VFSLYRPYIAHYAAPEMTSAAISEKSASYVKPRPDVRPGFTVRVHERIQEGGKERVQIFEGLVIAVHKGATAADQTFTVRRIASGVGVEKVFPLHSPKIDKIEVKKVARVRRAKLFFLRGRRGKSARLSERFTTADEFAVATPVEPEPVAEEEVVEAPKAEKEETEAPVEEAPKEEAKAEAEEEAPKE